MNQSSYYKTAIDILSDIHTGKRNPIEILQQVAKLSPKVLCDACAQTPWEREAKLIYVRDGKIAAIKFVRSVTGLGLKEAKELTEKWDI